MTTIFDSSTQNQNEITPELWFTDQISIDELHNQKYILQNRLYIAETYNVEHLQKAIASAITNIESAITQKYKTTSSGVRFHG